MKVGQFIKKHVNILFLVLIVLVLNWLGNHFYSRLDLTQEKKYSLSPTTKSFLRNLDDVVTVKVFLTGKLPSGMTELEQSTKDMLNEFKAYAGSNLDYDFIDITKMDKNIQEEIGKDLINLGLQPTSLTVVEDGEQTQKVIFPGAVVTYQGGSYPVTLLQNQVGLDQYQILSNSITLLEYNLANAIQKLQRQRPPTIAFSQGHGEASMEQMSEMVQELQKENFAIAAINLKESYRIEPIVDVLVLAKPTQPFEEQEKYKIDQFVMRGGSVFWLLDVMSIDMDSLSGGNFFFAQERDLNLADQLFKYGVRVNTDLVQDLNCTKIEVQTGMVNGAPQFNYFDWLYHPLYNGSQQHPLSKNLAPIAGKFGSTIDTIRNEGVQKQVLLTTGQYSKALLSPVRVHLGILGEQPDPLSMKQPTLPVAVALEGNFKSVFANRLTDSYLALQDTVEELKYLEESEPTKMIVIGDGDIIVNEFRKKQALPLGYSVYGPNNSALVFDNKAFLKNCFEYLIDDNNLIETRNKEFKLRQLNAIAVKNGKRKWQFINVAMPLILLAMFGLLYSYIRKRRFAR